MTLNEIRDRLSSLPTIMGISNELLIIRQLMDVDTNEFIENEEGFYAVLNDIEESHYSDFVDITKENEGEFITFHNWLKKIKSDLKLGINDNIIETFRLNSDEIERLMSNGIPKLSGVQTP